MAALDQPTRDVLDRLQVDVNAAPAVTPALLAYLRGLGMDLSTAEDIRAKRIGTVRSAGQEARSTTERNYEQTRKNVTGDLVRRGVLRSGEASTRFAKAAADNQAQMADIATNEARGIEESELSYGSTRDTLRRTALERLMDTEQQEAIRKATSESETRQIEAQKTAQEDYYRKLEELAKKGVV